MSTKSTKSGEIHKSVLLENIREKLGNLKKFRFNQRNCLYAEKRARKPILQMFFCFHDEVKALKCAYQKKVNIFDNNVFYKCIIDTRFFYRAVTHKMCNANRFVQFKRKTCAIYKLIN